MNPLLWVNELKAELPPAHEPREVIALLGTVFGPRYSHKPMFEVLPFVQVVGRPPEKSHEYKGTPNNCANDWICETQRSSNVIKARFSICSKIGYPYWTNKFNNFELLKNELLKIFNEFDRDCSLKKIPNFWNFLLMQEDRSSENSDIQPLQPRQ